MKKLLGIVFFGMIMLVQVGQANSQTLGPAPEGKAKVVATEVIQFNFDNVVCPKVLVAKRMPDGSITAACTNSEIFRVFSFKGKGVAMRCSVVKALGIEGC